ncbi:MULTISPECIES: aminoglycoside phosphotransferase family protein [Actinosynnema]|uniref:aminoglycoside phosphotransferase family protein n=1 Tax=Actinosynnema TaxID=40566 RepID=UPI0020A4CD34|nr:aminoglycoside phosphotransferase family protein [Actinosynnema pretiosum]MCP2098968.1 Thiamine kinase [Actinosynnema pretiosum]
MVNTTMSRALLSNQQKPSRTTSSVQPVTPSRSTSPLTSAEAERVLTTACRQVDLDPTDAELLRIGSNAVYRLRTPVIVRIAQANEDEAGARRQVAVARWLAAVDYPATRALRVKQPVKTDGGLVTFWESASEREDYAPITQVARLIRELHELPPPHLDLPAFEPFTQTLTDIEQHTGKEKLDFLKESLEKLKAEYALLTFPLPAGVIHGDANVGNVILDRDGNPLLIDLDNFAIGPREWDLVQTAAFYERFGWHTEAEYRTFVDVYGFDIMEWPGYRVLADYREIAMTVWLARKAAGNPEAGAELTKRLAALRTGGSRADWEPL